LARLDRESKSIEERLDQFEKLAQLTKTEFEMYFMGILKRAPNEKKIELDRILREISETPIQNTGLQFRARVLRSRYNTMAMVWHRTSKQIEAGTYKGHRVMAAVREAERAKKPKADPSTVREQIRALQRGEAPPPEPKHAALAAAGKPEAQGPATAPGATSARAERPGPPAAPPASPPPSAARAASAAPAASASSGGIHVVGSPELVREFAAVRQRLGEQGKVDGGVLEAQLRKHAENIKKQLGVREVRFRVVEEGGKARVKAVPVK
jgi:hypothetical protein